MFEKNILTFNPGWDSNAQKLASFTDVRDLQRQLKAQGVQLAQEADESTTRPASSPWTLMETRSSSISMCEQDGRPAVYAALSGDRHNYFLRGAAASSSSASVGNRSKVRSILLPRRFLSKKSIIAVQSSAVKAWPCFA